MKCCDNPRPQWNYGGDYRGGRGERLSSTCANCGHYEAGAGPSLLVRILRRIFGPDFAKNPEPYDPKGDIRKTSPFDPNNPYNRKP